MLSDIDIIERIKSGEIQIVEPDGISIINPDSGVERARGQLQSHGYDLRIDAVQYWSQPDWIELKEGAVYALRPGEFIAIRTLERIRLAKNIAGTVHGMARRTLLGLNHISTTVHPGWAMAETEPKPIVVAISNHGRNTIELTRGQSICRLMFHEVISPAERPAPSLEEVRSDFERIRAQNAKRYGRRSQIVGWLLIIISTLAVIAALALIQVLAPNSLVYAGPIGITLLTIFLAAIRRRFNILPGY